MCNCFGRARGHTSVLESAEVRACVLEGTRVCTSGFQGARVSFAGARVCYAQVFLKVCLYVLVFYNMRTYECAIPVYLQKNLRTRANCKTVAHTHAPSKRLDHVTSIVPKMCSDLVFADRS